MDDLRPQGDLSPSEWRILIAALAGPAREPFGASRQIRIVAGQAGAINLMRGSATRPGMVILRPIVGEPGFSFIVGPSQNITSQSSPTYTFPTESPLKFVVLPGEQLFIRQGVAVATSFLISEVWV